MHKTQTFQVFGFFSVILFFSFNLSGQDQYFGSLEVEKIRDLILENQMDSAFYIAEEMMRLSEGKSNEERAIALHMMGVMLTEKFEYNEAISLLEQSIKLSDVKGSDLYYQNRLILGRCHYFLGSLDEAKELINPLLEVQQLDSNYLYRAHYILNNVYFGDSDDEKCLEHLIKAHDIAIKLGKDNEAATLKSYLGFMYHRLDKDSIAFAMQDEALEYMMSVGDTIGAAFVISERATMYSNIDDWENSEKDFLLAIDYSLQKGHLPHAANSSSLLSDVYISLGDYDEALKYYTSSQKICMDYEIPIGILTNHIGLAELYLAMGKHEECIEEAEQAKEVAALNEYTEELATAHGILARAYAKTGRFEKAYISLEEKKAIRDSLFTLEKAESMGKLREQFEREKNLREIAELENEARVDALKRKGLWIGLGLVALLSLLVLNREVQRRKKAKQLHEVELKMASLEKTRLKEELDFKNRELTSHALNLARKNEFLSNLNIQLNQLKQGNNADEVDVRDIKNQLKIEGQMENNWEQFTKQFTATNPDFYDVLKRAFPDLSRGDLRLAALLKMNLGTKDIANILGISNDGVKKSRYRLRKKLSLDSNESLEDKVMMF